MSKLDPALAQSSAFWFSYVHPFWMLLSILVLSLALKQGLTLRQRRKRGGPFRADLRRLHVMAAKPAVIMLLVGAVGGPLSAVYLRGWTIYETAHAWIASIAAGLCTVTAFLGLRLLRGHSKHVETHGWLGLATIFAAVASVGTGLILLP